MEGVGETTVKRGWQNRAMGQLKSQSFWEPCSLIYVYRIWSLPSTLSQLSKSGSEGQCWLPGHNLGSHREALLRMVSCSSRISACTTTKHMLGPRSNACWKRCHKRGRNQRRPPARHKIRPGASCNLINLSVWAVNTVPEHKASSAAQGLSNLHSDQSKRTSV